MDVYLPGKKVDKIKRSVSRRNWRNYVAQTWKSVIYDRFGWQNLLEELARAPSGMPIGKLDRWDEEDVIVAYGTQRGEHKRNLRKVNTRVGEKTQC